MTPQRKTYLKRSTKPIARHKRLASSKRPIRARKADPKKRAWAKHRVPAFQAFVREQRCVLSEWPSHWCSGSMECCHIKTRGAGGDDLGNCFPACTAAHREQHHLGIRSFQDYYDVNLREIATELTAQYLGAHQEEP